MTRGGSRGRRGGFSRRSSRKRTQRKELWFHAEGERLDGAIWRFVVFKKGKAVSIFTPNAARGSIEHLCHASNQGTEERVMREIALVYKVTKVKKTEARATEGETI